MKAIVHETNADRRRLSSGHHYSRPRWIAQQLGLHFQKIREGIYVYGLNDTPVEQDPTSNCGIIITQEGVVLIHSGPNPPDSLIILKAVKQLTSQPVRFLINTATHNDHVTGNFVFSPPAIVIRSAGATAGIKNYYDPKRNEKLMAESSEMRGSVSRFSRCDAACGIQRPDDFAHGRSDFRADPTQEYPQ